MGKFFQIENNGFNVVVSLIEQLSRQKICLTEGFGAPALYISSLSFPDASTPSGILMGWISQRAGAKYSDHDS